MGKFFFRVKAFRLVEFEDKGTAGFDSGDTIYSTYVLGGRSWSGFYPQTNFRDTDADKVLNYTISSGPFSVVVHYSPTTVSLSGNDTTYDLDPSQIKFDYLITNYPWSPNCTVNCKLALDARVRTKLKTRVDGNSVVAEDSTDSTSSGGWGWADTVLADNVSIPVIASSLQASTNAELNLDRDNETYTGENSYTQYFTFDTNAKPSVIFWDPVVEASVSSLLSPGIAVFLCALLFQI